MDAIRCTLNLLSSLPLKELIKFTEAQDFLLRILLVAREGSDPSCVNLSRLQFSSRRVHLMLFEYRLLASRTDVFPSAYRKILPQVSITCPDVSGKNSFFLSEQSNRILWAEGSQGCRKRLS